MDTIISVFVASASPPNRTDRGASCLVCRLRCHLSCYSLPTPRPQPSRIPLWWTANNTHKYLRRSAPHTSIANVASDFIVIVTHHIGTGYSRPLLNRKASMWTENSAGTDAKRTTYQHQQAPLFVYGTEDKCPVRKEEQSQFVFKTTFLRPNLSANSVLYATII